MMVNTKPRRQRNATVADIVNRLRPKLSSIPGLRVSLSVPQAIRVGGRMSKSAYDYTLYGPDTAQLYAEAPKLERAHRPTCPACRTSPAICRSRRRASISCSIATAPRPCI